MATFVKISSLVESGESLMITFTGDKLKAGGYELNPVGTADEIKAKDTRIAVLERALEKACHVIFGYYEQSIDNPDYKTAEDFTQAFTALVEAELAEQAKEVTANETP